MNINEYRKVLIVNTQSMYKGNATGITLRNLWGNWPSDRLLEIYAEPYETEDPNSVKLKDNFVQRIVHSWKARKENNKKENSNQGKNVNNDSISNENRLHTLAILLYCSFRLNISKDVWQRIVSFSPDIIYTLGLDLNVLVLTNRIAKKLDIPIVVHYMDNWKEQLNYKPSFVTSIYHKRLLHVLRAVQKRSNIAFTISPLMTKVYGASSRIHHITLMNCVEFNDELQLNDIQQNKRSNQYNIVYAGGLHLERWKALAQASKVLLQFYPRVKLIIYTTQANRKKYFKYFENTTTEFQEAVSHDNIYRVYAQADALIHIESDDAEIIPFIKYSLSTKIAEYLTTGLPIIYHGPKNIAVCEYLKNIDAAYISSKPEELHNNISLLLKNDKDTMIKIRNSFRAAKQFHDKNKVQEMLRSSICSSVDDYNAQTHNGNKHQ